MRTRLVVPIRSGMSSLASPGNAFSSNSHADKPAWEQAYLALFEAWQAF